MPRILTGVEVTVTDKSNVIITNNSVIAAMVGKFQKGFTTPVLISNKDVFEKYFGTFNKAVDKKSYITAIKLLNNATGVYIGNANSPTAKYGWATCGLSSITAGSVGLSTNTSYDFTPSITGEAVTITGGAGFSLAHANILANSVTITYTAGGSSHTLVDDGTLPSGAFSGTDAATYWTLASCSIVYATGKVILTQKVNDPETPITNLTIAYTYDSQAMFNMIAVTPKSWSGSYGYAITKSSPELNTFQITEYYKDDIGNVTTVQDPYTVSRDEDAVDSNTGKTIYIETVVTEKSWLFRAINNVDTMDSVSVGKIRTIKVTPTAAGTGYTMGDILTLTSGSGNATIRVVSITGGGATGPVGTVALVTGGTGNYEVGSGKTTSGGTGSNCTIEILSLSNIPNVSTDPVYLGGGVDGSTLTDTDLATSLTAFNTQDIQFSVFATGGITSSTLLLQISELMNAKNAFAYCDTIADTAANVKTWIQSSVGIDNYKMAFYTPYAYVAYNGVEVYCPMSAIAAEKYCEIAKNGLRFMPPAGTANGTINVIRLDKYFTDAERLDLAEVEVNAVINIPGYGNVIFSDFTKQYADTATSSINAVLTLNDMIKTFKSNLIVGNYKVIDEETFSELRTMINGYLSRLALQKGTIKPNYKIIIDSSNNNAVTEDAKQIYAKVIFVFQGLAREIKLNLTFTSNAVFATLG